MHALREHKDRETSSATRSFSHPANKARQSGSVSSCQPDLRAGTGAQSFSSVSASERHRTAGEQAASFGRKLGPFARGASGRNGGQRACRRRRHGEGEQQRRESCKERQRCQPPPCWLTATSLGLIVPNEEKACHVSSTKSHFGHVSSTKSHFVFKSFPIAPRAPKYHLTASGERLRTTYM